MKAYKIGMLTAIAAFTGVCAQLVASSNAELMQTVQKLRAATLAAAPAGHGEVVMERQYTLQGNVREVPRHRGEFRFVGPDSLLVEYAADGKAVMQSSLWTESTLTRFVGAGARVPTQVLVDPRKWLPELDLQGFSFADVAAIPNEAGRNENWFFGVSFDDERIKVERVGNLISLHELFPAPPTPQGLISSEFIYDFDMVHGGMLARSREVQKERVGGTDEIQTVTDEWTWTWARVDGHIVPVKCARDLVGTKGTATLQKIHAVVEFTKFEWNLASAAKPTIDDMQIVRGTKIFDNVRGLYWNYFPGAAQMQAGPTTRSADAKERR